MEEAIKNLKSKKPTLNSLKIVVNNYSQLTSPIYNENIMQIFNGLGIPVDINCNDLSPKCFLKTIIAIVLLWKCNPDYTINGERLFNDYLKTMSKNSDVNELKDRLYKHFGEECWKEELSQYKLQKTTDAFKRLAQWDEEEVFVITDQNSDILLEKALIFCKTSFVVSSSEIKTTPKQILEKINKKFDKILKNDQTYPDEIRYMNQKLDNQLVQFSDNPLIEKFLYYNKQIPSVITTSVLIIQANRGPGLKTELDYIKHICKKVHGFLNTRVFV